MCIIVKYIEPNKNCILFSKLWREVIFVKETTVPSSGEVTYMVRYVNLDNTLIDNELYLN